MEDMNARSYAPWIIAGVTVVAVALIVCLTLLALEGKASEDLSRLMNSALNVITLLGVGGSWVTAAQAKASAVGAQSQARVVAEQTDEQLTGRVAAAMRSEMLGLREELYRAGVISRERA